MSNSDGLIASHRDELPYSLFLVLLILGPLLSLALEIYIP